MGFHAPRPGHVPGRSTLCLKQSSLQPVSVASALPNPSRPKSTSKQDLSHQLYTPAMPPSTHQALSSSQVLVSSEHDERLFIHNDEHKETPTHDSITTNKWKPYLLNRQNVRQSHHLPFIFIRGICVVCNLLPTPKLVREPKEMNAAIARSKQTSRPNMRT